MQNQPGFKREENQLPNHAILELTLREWDVLMCVTQDLTNSEIAHRLTVTSKSVENYRARIGNKLGLKGPRTLARFARQYSKELQHWYKLLFPLPS